MTTLALAIRFLTRIPAPAPASLENKHYGACVLWFPAVGLLIGAALIILSHALGGANESVRAALVLTCWVAITGGLHLDGLADCADAWIGGYNDTERSIAIMKDPHVGPIAVVALVLVLLIKYSAITGLLHKQQEAALLWAPTAGRAALVLMMLNTPYVSPAGLASRFLEHLPRRSAVWVVAAATGLLLAGSGPAAVGASAAAVFALRRLMLVRLGGATGDTYGATVEIVETAVLLAAAFGW